MKKIKNSFFIAVLVSLFFLPQNLSAFVPEGPNLLYYMLKKNGSYLTWFSIPEARIDYINDEKSVAMDIELYYSSTGVFRAETRLGEQTQIYMEAPERAVTIQGNDIISPKVSQYYLFKDIFLFNDYEQLILLLEKRGCSVADVRLDRKDGRIFYVLGQLPATEQVDSAELWVDRETFLPYLYKTHIKGEVFTFKYGSWMKSGSLKYPGIIDIFHDEIKVRKITARYINKNFKPDNAGFFDVERLVKLYRKNDSDLDLDLKNRVDSIKKIFE